MLRLIIRQTNWAILGNFLTFLLGLIVTTYVVRELGTELWGQYKAAHDFVIISDTVLSLGFPFVILKFFPNLIQYDLEKSKSIINSIFKYLIVSSLLFISIVFFFQDVLSNLLYSDYNDFSFLLFLVCLHVPISLFLGIINSLYRSILKIKELIIYGSVVYSLIRATLTFIIFHYTEFLDLKIRLFYFVSIELFGQLVILFILYFLLNKRIKIFSKKFTFNSAPVDDKIREYGLVMYKNSLISLLSTQAIPFLLSILLLAEQRGMYAIMLTVTGVSMFLNKNLRKVFSPIISKLFLEEKINKMNEIYKDTTFILNIFTIPFSFLLIFFIDELLLIFKLEYQQIIYCKPLIIILIISKMLALMVGNSGSIMTMAGNEREETSIQFIRGSGNIIFVLLFLYFMNYGLEAVVLIVFCSTLFEASSQFYFIKKKIGITPFNKDFTNLILFSLPIISYAVFQNIDINVLHYFFIPILIYLLYYILFFKKINTVYNKIKK